MLRCHLDPDQDWASRRPALIKATVDWILSRPAIAARQGGLDILDLGCGPGLYAAAMARAGHRVTGIDLSVRSLDWARRCTAEAGLGIAFRCGNYLELEDDAAYDLVMMIYCDFGALTLAEQESLLVRMRRALRPGGLLVFDVWGPDFALKASNRKDWSWQEGGFWSPRPHLLLEEYRHFPELGVAVRRSAVLDAATSTLRVFHLRDWYFTPESIARKVAGAGFVVVEVAGSVVRSPDFDAEVLFVVARKPEA
jgi:SAM-dependent methyltransferase